MAVTSQVLRKALSANSTASSFTVNIPTTTKPSGDGVFDLLSSTYGLHQSNVLSKFVQLIPYGIGSDTQTFSMRLWGWSQTNDSPKVWIPQLLVELACTITTGTDFAGLVASNYGVDAITVAAGDAETALVSPANNMQGSALVHLRGCELIEFDFDMTGATSGNCLWRAMDQ